MGGPGGSRESRLRCCLTGHLVGLQIYEANGGKESPNLFVDTEALSVYRIPKKLGLPILNRPRIKVRERPEVLSAGSRPAGTREKGKT